jgi:hypothetical protein
MQKVPEPAQTGKIPFDYTAAVLSYIGARRRAPEDDILCALQAAAEAHDELHGEDARESVNEPRLLFALVTSGVLRWHDAYRGAGLDVPLVYSLTAHGRRLAAERAS